MLRVRLLDPVTTETSFVVQGETRAPRDGAVAVPLVRVPAAERETGGVAVDVVGAGEIAERATRGLEPADPSELGDIVAGRESPSMIAFRLRPLAGSEPRSLTVTVVRYTPQAVLIANVEEARYRALASEDGRPARRGAVRGAQQPAQLPEGDAAGGRDGVEREVGGRPIRPGAAEQDAVLLPLEKGRAGEDAPTFVVELVYLQRIDEWIDKGQARLDAAGARSARVANGCRAVLLAALPDRAAARRVPRRRRSGSRSRRRCDRARLRRRDAPAVDHSFAQTHPDCRRSSIASGTKPADARSSARCRCT